MNPSPISFTQFPLEIPFNIFEYLSPKEIKTVGVISKQFNHIINARLIPAIKKTWGLEKASKATLKNRHLLILENIKLHSQLASQFPVDSNSSYIQLHRFYLHLKEKKTLHVANSVQEELAKPIFTDQLEAEKW